MIYRTWAAERELPEPIWAMNVTTAEIIGTVGASDIPKVVKYDVFAICRCSSDLISKGQT